MFAFVLLGCFLFLPASIGSEEGDPRNLAYVANLPALQVGNIIFRRVDGPTSHFLDLVDGQAHYSHVGIVMVTDGGEVLVINVVPGESGSSFVLAEPWMAFLEPALSFAIFRPYPEAGVAGALAADWAYSRVDEIPFDMKFNLETDDALYCTELVWKAYAAAGIDLVDGSFDELSFPFLDSHQYILPSRLMNSVFVYRLYPTLSSE